MKITIENYERYALDFLEGHLGHQDEKEFELFLDEHPHIKEEVLGVDEVILIPDLDMHYPDKKSLYRRTSGRIVPFWKMSGLIAAAVTLLLVTAAILFFRNSPTLPGEHLTDNQTTHTGIPDDYNKLPATKTPMPAEQSETSVMAREGNVPDLEESIIQGSPALTFGSKDENSPSSTGKNSSGSITQGKSETADKIAIQNPEEATLATNETIEPIESVKPGETVETIDIESPSSSDQQSSALAFLPPKSGGITTDYAHHISNLTPVTRAESSESFEFHIPGQFLSETWTDVSLSNIKDQLLPEFIKKRQNL